MVTIVLILIMEKKMEATITTITTTIIPLVAFGLDELATIWQDEYSACLYSAWVMSSWHSLSSLHLLISSLMNSYHLYIYIVPCISIVSCAWL